LAEGGAVLALEVVALPVSNVDHALEFYVGRVGFNLDVDYQPTASFRVVQLTPIGSACSIHLVQAPDSRHNLFLVTDNLEATREQLVLRGIKVSAIRHKDPVDTWAGGWRAGVDPHHRDYCSFADFADPDGNTWTLQERGYRAQ
jgi:catechol 2,3-dioxygenase-like lactoylglutathione lyase family enzyme